MSLQRQDFELPDKVMDNLNRAIQEISKDYRRNAPQEDPLDGLSVVFSFVPGLERQIEVHLGGRCVDVDC
ncbi:hypothetical protein MED193_19004 [Roseobacter sp. MED193]|uniref:hypothetical protein n=1 Tax=Roseobacter sp. MED193 TaxID=314262 RepID=UPI000068B9DE|nr:hypothetical protein [Roseobacter sp. MED193]EAQ47312.1 hypothetical protein MED193_19004 [Roseobacter sp. MED193]